MADGTKDLGTFEARVGELDARRWAWKWSPQNPLPQLEAEILQVLEELINMYPNVTEEQRSYIRRMIQKLPGVGMYLQAVAAGDIRKFKSDIAPERLYPALIAVSMANSIFGDYRDFIVLLGSLWLCAAQARIDPTPYFKSAAALSDSNEILLDGLSMKALLATFHNSAYFKEDVQPFLPK